MHTINLTGAWDRFDLPAGGTGWARWFGRPTGLEPPLEAWLVAEPIVLGRLWLNGMPLAPVADATIGLAVTRVLTRRNRLLLPPAGLDAAAVAQIDNDLAAGRWAAVRSALSASFGKVMLAVEEPPLDFQRLQRR